MFVVQKQRPSMKFTSDEMEDELGPLMDEFLERKRRGEYPALTEFVSRHPELENEIRDLFPAVAMMEHVEASESKPIPTAATRPDGQQLDRLGDYRIIREIGRGGMGVVYEAIQESLGRHVALKLLPWQVAPGDNHVKRFQREARIAASLHHTNIVPVYGVGHADGIHFLAMQFIHGQSLSSVLKELKHLRDGHNLSSIDSPAPAQELQSNLRPDGRPNDRHRPTSRFEQSQLIANSLVTQVDAARSGNSTDSAFRSSPHSNDTTTSSPSILTTSSGRNSTTLFYKRAAELVAGVADALEFAHTQGVLHCGIKPANLMLDIDGGIWVTDFGLAKADVIAESSVTDTHEQADDLTHTGDIVGTLRYLAPERFSGINDRRSDVYSLGLTLYEFLTLEPAFSAVDRVSLIHTITNGHCPRPRKITPDIPQDLETIIVKGTHPDPEFRYQTAKEMALDLRRFIDNKPIVARRASPIKRLQLWCRRNPGIAVLRCLAVSLLVMVAAVSSYSAIALSKRQSELFASLRRAVDAESRERAANQLATENLFDAYVARARSGRENHRPGRRYDGLEAIANASALRDQVNIDEQQMMQLRNEAIACMGLADIRLETEGPDTTTYCSFNRWGFDSTIEHYAKVSESTGIEVLTLEGNNRIAHFSSGWKTTDPPLTCFSPDDRYVAILGLHRYWGTAIEIWDIRNGSIVLPCVPTNADWFSRAISFSCDSQLAAFAGVNQLIVFDLESRQVVKTRQLQMPPAFIRFCSTDGRVVIGLGNDVAIFEWNSDDAMTLLRHSDYVSDATFSNNGRHVATARYDHKVYVWDQQNPDHPVTTCSGHTSKALRVEFSPDDRMIMSNAWDDTSRFWNPWSGQQVMRVNRYASRFSADGRRLALQETGMSVGRWEVADSQACRVLGWKGKSIGIYDAKFNPSGTLLAHTAARSIVVRDWPSGKVRHVLPTLQKTMKCQFAMDNSFLYSVGYGQFCRWQTSLLTNDSSDAVIASHQVLPTSSTVMFDLADDGSGGIVRLSEQKTHRLILTDSQITLGPELPSLPDEWFVETNNDGSLFALTGKHLDIVRVLRAADDEVVFQHQLPADLTANPLFSPHGKWLLLSTRRKAMLFETATWQLVQEIRLTNAGFGRAAFSRDESLLALHDGEGVRLVQTAGFRTLAWLQNPYGESFSTSGPEVTFALAFSPNNQYLACGTGGETESMYVWDLHFVQQKLTELKLAWPHDMRHTKERQSASADLHSN